MANRFLSNIRINDAYTFPASDGTNGQVISTDGSGNLSFVSVESQTGSTVIYQDNFSGDGSTVDFTLSNSVSDEVITQVYIDGVYQNKDTYSVSNTTLTFSTAPSLNSDVEVITFNTATTADDLQAGVVIIPVKNTHTASIAKGEPVYITGNVGSSSRLEIAPADASDSAKMPAAGLLLQTLAVNQEGYAVTGGYLRNITTDTIDGTSTSSNDTVYVKSGGGLTMTKPTGSNLIQNIAKVARSASGNAGSLIVSSILRTNDVPNLTTGKIWVGSTNTVESTVIHLDETNNRLGINNTTPAYSLDVTGTANITGNITTSGTVDGVDIAAFKTDYDSHTHTESEITDFGNYLTNVTHDTVNTKLVVTKRDGTTTDLSLSQYIDDTNLARLTSGTLNSTTGIATFTRDDATTFTVDFSALFDDTDTNDYVSSASFNTSDGILTLTRTDAGTVTVDLDGRYLESYTETDTLATVTARGATTTSDLETGRLTIANNVSTGGFGSFNDYQIILYEDTTASTSYGLGIESSTFMFHTNGAYKFYANNAVKATISNSGDLTLTGTISASGYNNSNWDTAYGWGDHSAAGYQSASSAITTSNISSQSVDNADKLDSRQLDGATGIGERLFNNQGRTHSSTTDFNSTGLRAGVNYIQGGTNGPTGTSSHQWYGFRIGLGSDYGTTTGASQSYASDLFWNRQSQGGSPYLWARDLENGTWGSWRKMSSGYADNAGTLDGLDSSQFLRSDAADTATGMITFSGSTRFPDTNGTVQSMWGIYGWDTQLQFTKRNLSTDAYEGTAMFIDYSSLYVQSDYSFRAPIFYDSNNTAWYTNPASRSILNTLQLGGSSSDTTNLKLDVQGNMAIRGSSGLYYGVTTNNYNSWTTRMYASGSTQYLNAQQFIFDNQGYGSTTFLTVNTNGIYAPVLYDSNDTNYYVDPASTSVLNGLTVGGSDVILGSRKSYGSISGSSGDWYPLLRVTDFNGPVFATVTTYAHSSFSIVCSGGYGPSNQPSLQVLSTTWNNNGGYANATGVRIRQDGWVEVKFEWSSGPSVSVRVQAYNSAGTPVTFANSLATTTATNTVKSTFGLTTTGAMQANYTWSNVDQRAPIFYDSDNTNYYVDPASTSTVRKTNIVASGSGWYDGLNLISSDASNTWNLLVDNGASDMFRVAFNSSEKFRIQTNGEVYTIGTGQAGSDYRAPIFYDSNNTGRYIDPASTSVIDKLEIANTSNQEGPGATMRIASDGFIFGGNNNGYESNSAQISAGYHTSNSLNIVGMGTVSTNRRVDMWAEGGFYVSGTIYDKDSTGYYCNPASTTNLNALTATRIGVNPSGSSTSRYGVSLYAGYSSGEPTYGLLFTGTSLGSHGAITGDWATYFTMNNDTSRGWIFRRVGSGNCASISAGGHATFDGSVITPFVDIDKTSQYGPGMDLTFSGSNSTGILIRNNTGATTQAISFYYSSAPQGARGSITVSSTSTAYNTSSDYRLKENVVPMTGSLERIDQLNPSRFNFIGDDKTVDGFLAHEAAEVVPEAVTGTKDEVDEEGNPVYQGIDQAKLVPLLVGAIQELKAEVEALKQQLNGTN